MSQKPPESSDSIKEFESHERDKFEQVLEEAQMPVIMMKGPEHRVTYANSAYNKLFVDGGSPVGKTIAEVLPDAMDQGFGKLLDRVYQTGESFVSKEALYSRKFADGRVVDLYLDFTYAAKRDREGRIEGVAAFIIDVTDKVLARRQAEERKEFLDQVFDLMPQMSFQADPQGNIISFNRRWYEYIGDRGETLGWGWKDRPIHHPEDLPRTMERWAHSLATGDVYEIEYRLLRHDNEYRWHLGRAVPLRDRSGQITAWFGTNTDIHDQKMAAERIAASERLLSLTANTIPELMAYLDRDSRYRFVNQTYEKWFNRPASEFLKSSLFEVAGPDRAALMKPLFERALRGEAVHFDDEANYPVGHRFVRISFVPDIDPENDSVRGVVLLVRDETDRKRSEMELHDARLAADEANAAKSAFLANMSHEIRTPLGAIMGFSELMQQTPELPAEASEYLEVIQRNSVQTLKIIDDILDLAKVEAGKVVIEKLEVNLLGFLADFASLMGFRARENGIGFRLQAETDLPDQVMMDPTRVRQVLTNAVGNAIKFTSQGGVLLSVCYKKGCLEFGIQDTGRGISPEQASQLFQAFVQADVSTTRKYGGTGLGLVLTKRLCQAMGGDYTLTASELGVGSHFLARISVEMTEKSNMLHAARVDFGSKEIRASSLQKGPTLDGIKVLVVEDSPDNQELLKRILQKQGASFTLAVNGAEGVRAALNEEFDVVLMDVQMPVMDGHEAVRALRSRGFQTPIVALTAHAMKEEYERAMQSGFTDYLSKPVQQRELIGKVFQYGRKS